jgi:cytochrome c peroxidase
MSRLHPLLALTLAVCLNAAATAQGRPPAEPEALEPLAALGQKIFHDTSLSSPPGQACASCHDPERAMTDPDTSLPTSRGVIPGRAGNRNTPTAMYAAFSPYPHVDADAGLFVGGQFLDGRAATLEVQARGPFLNPLEMANPDAATVVAKLRAAPYAEAFLRVFGPDALDEVDAAYARIAQAIAAFERTTRFAPFSSKYDAYLAGRARLSGRERRGLAVFEDPARGNCAACHTSAPAQDGTPPLFTDFSYDNLGVPRNPANPFYRQPANAAGHAWVDTGLGATTGLAGDEGKFKVPTLRNITRTAPYMHNGYFASLRGVIEFYNSRDRLRACRSDWTDERSARRAHCWPAPEVARNVNADELGNLGLSEREIDDLLAFLDTLTDGWTPRHP